ncbi:MAG: hypothetical protein O9284_04520 [Steroidobacteraceae bacterium]|nr:hypothetical protein [Steroidobacteraceae bacterium]
MKPREPSRVERAVPWLLGAAILFATVMGIGGLFEAQTGRWGPAGVDPERPAAVRPDVVAAPELAPATAQVYACRDADGREVYLDRACPAGTTGGPVEVATLELAPVRDPSAAADAPAASVVP